MFSIVFIVISTPPIACAALIFWIPLPPGKYTLLSRGTEIAFIDFERGSTFTIIIVSVRVPDHKSSGVSLASTPKSKIFFLLCPNGREKSASDLFSLSFAIFAKNIVIGESTPKCFSQKSVFNPTKNAPTAPATIRKNNNINTFTALECASCRLFNSL